MKKYDKILIPKNTVWDRRTWRNYAPIWFKVFCEGVYNIVRWIPTLYKDRDWDDYYITKILQKKIEHQRKHLIKANRHLNIERDNFWMTLVLNLIEREHEDFYGLELYDYQDSKINFVPSKTHPESFEMETVIKWENLDEYINKYKGAKHRVIKKYKGIDLTDKHNLSLYIGMYNQERCRDLIFEILKRYSAHWWD